MFPSDTKFADWMSWFCSDGDTTIGKKLSQPFRLPNGLRCASDARFCVAAAGDAPEHADPTYPSVCMEKLYMPIIHSVTVDAASLRDELGKLADPEEITCPRCRGKKQVEHICNCELCDASYEKCYRCDGTGKCGEEVEQVRMVFFGKQFDRERVAYILEHCPHAERYEIGLSGSEPMWLLNIKTDEWKAILISMQAASKLENPKIVESKLCRLMKIT